MAEEIRLAMDRDEAALVARACRYTAGEEAGGVDTEALDDAERSALLHIAIDLTAALTGPLPRPCPMCGALFVQPRTGPHKKWCSMTCREKAHHDRQVARRREERKRARA